jgi:hypothetical protein
MIADMNHIDFSIGVEFWCDRYQWRCTDVGSRVIVAIRVDGAAITTRDTATDKMSTSTLTKEQAEAWGWFDGRPYGCIEHVFDEGDFEACILERSSDG